MRLEVVEYDDGWPIAFERERMLLESVLAPWLVGGVQHIGSTSIPGIAAKPSLDMMAGVRRLDESRAAIAPLAALRYVHDVHRPDALWFHKSSLDDPDAYYTHGLHLTVPGSDLWVERLTFRDAVRADPAVLREYEALKRRLANVAEVDVGAYTAAKRQFVARVLADAGVVLNDWRSGPRSP